MGGRHPQLRYGAWDQRSKLGNRNFRPRLYRTSKIKGEAAGGRGQSIQASPESSGDSLGFYSDWKGWRERGDSTYQPKLQKPKGERIRAARVRHF